MITLPGPLPGDAQPAPVALFPGDSQSNAALLPGTPHIPVALLPGSEQ